MRARPLVLLAAAVLIAAAGVVVMAALAGFGAVGDAAGRFAPPWLVLVAAGQVVAYAGHVVAYRSVARVEAGLAARLVAAGFGAHALRGGFAFDARALRGLRGRSRRPVIRVLGLGALEWALLAPAACLCALVLLLGGSGAQRALLWSWVLAVPAGFSIGLWAADPQRVERLERREGWRGALGRGLAGVGVLRRSAAHPVRCAGAWLGLATYWAGDIASFYGALRAFGVHVSFAILVLAYATGYAATRRSLPLGGAGVTEVLMTLSLHWVGLPLAAAVAPVALYRVASFVLPSAPASAARDDVEHLLRRGDRVAAGRPAVTRSGSPTASRTR